MLLILYSTLTVVIKQRNIIFCISASLDKPKGESRIDYQGTHETTTTDVERRQKNKTEQNKAKQN